ncbi:MAG: response regulator [Pseudomonadota bacterium]
MVPRVFVVEPDVSRRVRLELRLMEEGYAVETFESAADFKKSFPEGAEDCCIVVNAELPDMCGVELLEWISGAGCAAQGVVICPSADVHLAVRGMRAGAVDIIDDEDPRERVLERLTEIHKCPCSVKTPAKTPTKPTYQSNQDKTTSPYRRDCFSHLPADSTNHHPNFHHPAAPTQRSDASAPPALTSSAKPHSLD